MSKKRALAANRLSKELPQGFAMRYLSLYGEYRRQTSKEARLANAIQALDAEIHELDYRQDWDDWTEKFLRDSKQHYFAEFPELLRLFESHVRYLREKGYFSGQ